MGQQAVAPPLPGRTEKNTAELRIDRGDRAVRQPDLQRLAARFAGEVGPDRLIGLSHSEFKDEGVVTVWYWE